MKPAIRQVPRISGLQNENGPAEVAASVPSHGSNIPHEETKMNKTDNSTAPSRPASDFPIPYHGTAPTDDLFAARSFLRVVQGAVERASGNSQGMSKTEANDMLHVVGVVAEKLETLQRLLDDDAFPGFEQEYVRVRREEIAERVRATL